jgi:GTP-binding protein Era
MGHRARPGRDRDAAANGSPAPPEGKEFRAGYAAILGRPNVGKSTLLNALLDQKLAIVTPRPQTTRHRILAVRNLPDAQVVFLDTPGIHESRRPLNAAMVRTALAAMSEAEVVVLMVEAAGVEGEEDEAVLRELSRVSAPIVVALNKIDLVPKKSLLPQMARWSERLPGAPIVPLSALRRERLDALLSEIVARLPEGPPFFPPDQITDQPERFFAAEIIRGKIFQLTGEEVPYASAVTIEEFREDPKRGLVSIRAVIHVEKESQKAIVIGKAGARLKQIGTTAREEIEVLLGSRVFLGLWVKVDPNWTRDERAIQLLGYKA